MVVLFFLIVFNEEKNNQSLAYYFLNDPLGTPLMTAVLTPDSPTPLLNRYPMDPWGNMVGGKAFLSTRLDSVFTGKVKEDDLDVYYFYARFYDPWTMRFLGEDPVAPSLEQPLSLNPFVYGLNNPVKYVDYDGRDVVAIHGGWTGNWQSMSGIVNNMRGVLSSSVFRDVPSLSLNFQHSGFMQSNPNHATSLISSYQHQNDSLKIFWGHSMGADAMAKAFGKKGMAFADEINLVMPRASLMADNLQIMSQNAGRVNVFMMPGDSKKYVPGYGDRSLETVHEMLKGKDIPNNVNIMQIPGFYGTSPHGGAMELGSPVLDSIWNQYRGIR